MWNKIKEWAIVIIIALAIAMPIRFFIAEPFVVSGASMDPTFGSGQFLIVDRLTYRFNEPQRDDVVVFKNPNNTSIYFIKRIIGLPGETIEIKDGKIFITNPTATSSVGLSETFIANSHISHDNMKITLGQNQFFVMGDNRADSFDSRSWGPLNRNLMIGRPILRLLPINKLSIIPGKYHE